MSCWLSCLDTLLSVTQLKKVASGKHSTHILFSCLLCSVTFSIFIVLQWIFHLLKCHNFADFIELFSNEKIWTRFGNSWKIKNVVLHVSCCGFVQLLFHFPTMFTVSVSVVALKITLILKLLLNSSILC